MIACADLNKVNTYKETKLHYKMVTGCQSRGFDELLGYVDFKVQSILQPNHEIQMDPILQAMSICSLEPANATEIGDYNAILTTLQSSVKDKFTSELQTLTQMIQQADEILNDKTSNKELQKHMIEQLEAVKSSIDDIVEEVKTSETYDEFGEMLE